MSAGFRGRREDLRLLTGQGKYTSDWNLPGQLYGYFVRSDRAHADIASIDASAAKSSTGVAAVLTGADTAKAGFKSTPQIARYPGRGGATIKVPHRDGLANGRVRFVGQEVALVVASTALAAQDAAEKIEVEYRDLPVVVDAEAALAPGAEQLYPEIPGNLCFDYEYGDEAKTDEAFSRAAHVTRVALDSQRVVGNPMEPKACLAAYDARADKYDLYVSSQGLSLMRGSASGITGIPAERIMVHAQDVGGGFGIRSDAYAEYCVAMLAAKILGKPVKWTSTRSETFLSDYHGRAAKLIGELALDGDGKFLAIRINWFVNAGAYLSTPGALINTLPPGLHAINLCTAFPSCTAAIASPSPTPRRPPPTAEPAGPTCVISQSAWSRRPRARQASSGSSCAAATSSPRTLSLTRRRTRTPCTTAATRTAWWTKR